MAIPLAVAIPAAASVLGAAFSAWGQGKMSDAQLKAMAAQLKLSKEQFEFMKQQALRQNQIQEANVGRLNPLLTQMLGRAKENMGRSPDYARLAPPNINNPYQPGVGTFGNQAPPVIKGMPWLNYGGQQPQRGAAAGMPDPRELARIAATKGFM